MTIIATRRDHGNHREPKYHEPQELSGPDNAGIENLSENDLANGEQHHAAQQRHQCEVFELAANSIEPGDRSDQ